MSVRVTLKPRLLLGIYLFVTFILIVKAFFIIFKSAADIFLVFGHFGFFQLLQERCSIPLCVSDEVSKILLVQLVVAQDLASVSVPGNQYVRLLECYKLVVDLLPTKKVAVEILRSHQV